MLEQIALNLQSSEANVTFDLIELGQLYLPTGKIKCCDPFLNHEVNALDHHVIPGNYPVRLAVFRMQDWGKRVGFAALVFSKQKPDHWRRAIYEIDGRRFSSFRVDAGIACFMDEQTSEIFSNAVYDFYNAHPDGNYYLDVLATEFNRHIDLAFPNRDGNWNMHFPFPDDPRNVAMFASGLGDGSYPMYWGLDANNQPAILLIDFELITSIMPTSGGAAE